MLLDQIVRAQQGDQEETLALIRKFAPAIRKWGRKLYEEDGKEDMVLAFLEILHSIKPEQIHRKEDATVVMYIIHSIQNAYFQMLQKHFHQPKIDFSLNATEEMDKEDALSVESAEDAEGDLAFFDLLDRCTALTEKEKQVLILIYFFGYTATEIATAWETSKQNVNQMKQRGLRKLRQWMKF